MKGKHYKIEIVSMGQSDGKYPTRNYSSTQMKKKQTKVKTNRINSFYPDMASSHDTTIKDFSKFKSTFFSKDKNFQSSTPKKQMTSLHNQETKFMEIVKLRPNPSNKEKVIKKLSKFKRQKTQKQQRNNTLILTKMKFHERIAERLKTLPKLQNQTSMMTYTYPKPLLSPLDSNLKKIKSRHYFILENETDQSILSNRSKFRIQVASLTKIMTFYVCIKISQQNQVDITKQKVKIHQDIQGFVGTTAQLQAEQIYTIEQLLYGLMLPSGNDAALALAKWGGSFLTFERQLKIKLFVRRMNDEARKLGLKDTRYGNPHGLPHKMAETTCEDMARLCSICLKLPLFVKIIGTSFYETKIQYENRKRKQAIKWNNTNKLLRRKGFIGIKTGITITAGPCLASAYSFRDKTYIVILAKATKSSRRFKETRKLLVHCFERMDFDPPLTDEERRELKKLNKSNIELDSDYSEEEKQFDFQKSDGDEMKRRVHILRTHQ